MRRKALKEEVSISELLYMREQGMTNKAIAESLGVHVNTIYRYIGRRSQAVKYAEVQGKACPIPNPTNVIAEEKEKEPVSQAQEVKKVYMNVKPVKEENQVPAVVHAPAASADSYQPPLPILKERRIVEMQGEFCVFEVDTGDKTIVMKDRDGDTALVTGLLDMESAGKFIRELMKLYSMLQHS